MGKALVTSQQIIELQHGTVAELARVLMPRNTYPKIWKSSGNADEQKK